MRSRLHQPTDDQPVSVAQAWSFAILTDDPDRQAYALRLIRTLLEPSIQGRWTQHTARVPSTHGAMATWDPAQPYYQFLSELMESDVAVIPGGRDLPGVRPATANSPA